MRAALAFARVRPTLTTFLPRGYFVPSRIRDLVPAALICCLLAALAFCGTADARAEARPCGHAKFTTASGRMRLYLRVTPGVRCRAARRVIRGYFARVPSQCQGSGCFIELPHGWTCSSAPGAVSQKTGNVTNCTKAQGKEGIFTSRFPRRGFQPDRPGVSEYAGEQELSRRSRASSAAGLLPTMIYPTLDYGSPSGG